MVGSRPSPACRRMSMRVLAEPSPGGLVQRGRAVRTVWLLLGLVLVGIGLIGIVVPLLTNNDFMLQAFPCFARSYPKLDAMILHHLRFGQGLRAWQTDRTVSRNPQHMALTGSSNSA